MNEAALRGLSLLGFFVLIAIAAAASSDRRGIDRRLVLRGIGLQFLLAGALLATPLRQVLFPLLEIPIALLLQWTTAGTAFLFGPLLEVGPSFALGVLPVILFMGSLFGVFYHVGLVQPVVRILATGLGRTLRVSGAEGLSAVANLFFGMIESGIVIRPYLSTMTRSELFTFMTLGMSTIAGTVLVAYVAILGGGDFAGHLIVASLISAPAALVVAKIIVPEHEQPVTLGSVPELAPSEVENVIDAAAEGALVGLRLALNIGALLIAFVALIAMLNSVLGGFGSLFGYPDITLQGLLGLFLSPLAFLMGIPWSEAREVGALIGLKTMVNEFVAYQELAKALASGAISERSGVIAAYALCGFANFGSLAILLGGIQAIAPERRQEAASLGLRSIFAGTVATCMTGCLAGLLA